MKQHITAITLGVTDIDASRRFYKQGLGLTPASEPDDEVSFFNMAPGVVLCLYGGLAADAGVERSGPGLTAIAHNVPEKGQVDAVLAEAASAGGLIIKPAEDTVWGGRSGYFADPDGHHWEVAWNPFWETTAGGGTRVPPDPT